jgi:hypothetical protein
MSQNLNQKVIQKSGPPRHQSSHHHFQPGIQPGSLEELEAKIEAMEFRALSMGLGLGDLKRQDSAAQWQGAPQAQNLPNLQIGTIPSQPPGPARETLPAKSQPFAQSLSQPFAQPLQQNHLQNRSGAKSAPESSGIGVARRLTRMAAALFVDGTVVALTLVVALTVAGWVIARDAGQPVGVGIQAGLAPLKWLIALGPVALLGVWAGVFLIYALTMALVAGGTVGWSVCGLARGLPYPQKNLVIKPNAGA